MALDHALEEAQNKASSTNENRLPRIRLAVNCRF